MTVVLPDLDAPPAPVEESEVCHIVCQGKWFRERTVPMFALCGEDVTFHQQEKWNTSLKECEVCSELWPVHVKHCGDSNDCRIRME